MGIKVGDVDVINEIISLHFQLSRTQLILDRVLTTNPQLAQAITPEFLRQIDAQALEQMQRKFPNMGISKTSP